MATVTVDPTYGRALNSIRGELAAGLVPFGYIITHPSWPTPPAANAKKTVMADCLDTSHSGQKDAKTGQTKTVGKTRVNTRVTFVKGHDAKWRIEQYTFLKASC